MHLLVDRIPVMVWLKFNIANERQFCVGSVSSVVSSTRNQSSTVSSFFPTKRPKIQIDYRSNLGLVESGVLRLISLAGMYEAKWDSGKLPMCIIALQELKLHDGSCCC